MTCFLVVLPESQMLLMLLWSYSHWFRESQIQAASNVQKLTEFDHDSAAKSKAIRLTLFWQLFGAQPLPCGMASKYWSC